MEMINICIIYIYIFCLKQDWFIWAKKSHVTEQQNAIRVAKNSERHKIIGFKEKNKGPARVINLGTFLCRTQPNNQTK